MIDETIMNEIIPLPTEEEVMKEIKDQLDQEGWPINNYNKGGIMYGLTRILVRSYLELLKLARLIVNSCFCKHASGAWLDVKSADYGKRRKQALKTRGYITITRKNYDNSVIVYRGHGFKTLPDINGIEKKYYCVEDTVLKAGQQSGKVLIEAEYSGSEYNVAPGRITVSMVAIEGAEKVTNEEGWLQREAASKESDEALRERDLNSYSELAERTTSAKLKSKAEAVEGVISVTINDQHPRGQGTTDIIVTGAAGEATEDLLERVKQATEYLRGNYDDYLYKSSTVIRQAISLTIYLAEDASLEGVGEQAVQYIRDKINIGREDLDVLYLDDIRYVLKTNIRNYRTSFIEEPVSDIKCEAGTVILPGEITVKVDTVDKKVLHIG